MQCIILVIHSGGNLSLLVVGKVNNGIFIQIMAMCLLIRIISSSISIVSCIRGMVSTIRLFNFT